MKWNTVVKVWKKSWSWYQWDMKENVGFWSNYRVVTPYFDCLVQNETLLWRFERNWSWCQWDMKENVRFWSKYRVVTPYFDRLMKWNPVMKVWKKLELMSMRYEGKCCFRVSIGLLPLILIISWNETLLWRFERNRKLMLMRHEEKCCVLEWDMKENVVF